MADADDGADASEEESEYGGFVFENEPTSSAEGSFTDEPNRRRVAGLALLVVSLVALAVAAQPFVTGAVTSLFDGDSEPASGGANATTTVDTTVSGDAPAAVGGDPTAQDSGEGATTAPSDPAETPTTASPATATPSPAETTPTATPSPTVTAAEGRSPVVERFAVSDQSSGGDATFDIEWNVTDPDVDLVGIEVFVVADPDGEAETIEQQSFDAGGASTTGGTTVEIGEGAGEVYEVSIEVTDGTGNTAFELTREVADGSSDG